MNRFSSAFGTVSVRRRSAAGPGLAVPVGRVCDTSCQDIDGVMAAPRQRDRRRERHHIQNLQHRASGGGEARTGLRRNFVPERASSRPAVGLN